MTSDDTYSVSAMIDSVRLGLGRKEQKELPCMYLYDELGSALFEAICVLPEYGLARAGERLLRANCGELVRRLPRPVVVAELGSGSGKNARCLLEALSQRQRSITYFPIEISSSALSRCSRELEGLEQVTVIEMKHEYLDGLREVGQRRSSKVYLLVLFLGSTIGNFNRESAIRFLQQVRRFMDPGDALVLGTDLVKPEELLLKAYDDPTGVTAAFNLNLLARLNRELGADFVLPQFRHEARFNRAERRVEMHLRSLTRQKVSIAKAGMEIWFQEGESIWTESSHKYAPDELAEMASLSGFRLDVQWIDTEWPFAKTLLFAA